MFIIVRKRTVIKGLGKYILNESKVTNKKTNAKRFETEKEANEFIDKFYNLSFWEVIQG